MTGPGAVPCLPHRHFGCTVCHPAPAAQMVEERPNAWHRDGDGWLRHDTDGTVWAIERAVAGGVDMVMAYREHRLRSHHDNATAAKKHRTDLVRAWQAQSMREYRGR